MTLSPQNEDQPDLNLFLNPVQISEISVPVDDHHHKFHGDEQLESDLRASNETINGFNVEESTVEAREQKLSELQALNKPYLNLINKTSDIASGVIEKCRIQLGLSFNT